MPLYMNVVAREHLNAVSVGTIVLPNWMGVMPFAVHLILFLQYVAFFKEGMIWMIKSGIFWKR